MHAFYMDGLSFTNVNLCNYHHNHDTEYHVNPQCSLTASQLFSLWLFVIVINFTFSIIAYRWNHIVCTVLSLASFAQHNAFVIYSCFACQLSRSFFIFISNIKKTYKIWNNFRPIKTAKMSSLFLSSRGSIFLDHSTVIKTKELTLVEYY